MKFANVLLGGDVIYSECVEKVQRSEWTRGPEDERTTSPALSLGIPPVGDHCGAEQSVNVGWAIHFTLSGNQRAIGKPTTSRRTPPQLGGRGRDLAEIMGLSMDSYCLGGKRLLLSALCPSSPAVYSSRTT